MRLPGSRIHGLLLAFLAVISPLLQADMARVVPLPVDPAAAINLPDGFEASVFARIEPAGGEYFRGPRFMAFGPDGHLYLSLGLGNKVVMLPDRNRDGRADEVVLVADRLNGPQGLAFVDGKLLVANQDGVVRLEQRDGRWPASAVTPLIRDLPAGGHTMKSLRLGPDGFLYVNVGSSCNVCVEQDPLRATLLRFSIDGRPAGALPSLGRHATSPVWAGGLRNAQGFAWHPVSKALFATNNGADNRSDTKGGRPVDDLPPEHFYRIEPGMHYGWPHCWGDRVPDPNFPGPAEFCQTTRPPALTLPAHSTPIGISFLDRSAFPSDYQSDALVALHGSWNRSQPSGYKIVRVHFKDGNPVAVSDFATGWLEGKAAWGRPLDLAVGPDRALYVSDDRAGLVFRISYRGAIQ